MGRNAQMSLRPPSVGDVVALRGDVMVGDEVVGGSSDCTPFPSCKLSMIKRSCMWYAGL